MFQQLGLLDASRPKTTRENLEGKECKQTNYALVCNVYDDSTWVLWRKLILYPGTTNYSLAKDLWPEEYAVFPGIEGETAVFAKLADDWDQLGPGTDLRLSRIFRALSSRKQVEEPFLMGAVRTKEGGIRRENDFRAIRLRERWTYAV